MWSTTKDNTWKYSLLCGYGILQQNTKKLCFDWIKNRKANARQLNMYLNYYKTEVNDETDLEPIGIILCTDKDSIQAEYALGNLSNQIFASKYTLYIPDREILEAQVERVLRNYNRKWM